VHGRHSSIVWAGDVRRSEEFGTDRKPTSIPRSCGWKIVATVDTRSSDESRNVGQFRGKDVTDENWQHQQNSVICYLIAVMHWGVRGLLAAPLPDEMS